MSQMTIHEPINVTGPLEASTLREVRAGRWQNAARISGRSEHDLRLQYDRLRYRPIHEPSQPVARRKPKAVPDVAFALPRMWQAKLRSRMQYLGLTLGDVARECAPMTFREVDDRLFHGGIINEFLFRKVDAFLWPHHGLGDTVRAAPIPKPPRPKSTAAPSELVLSYKRRMGELGWDMARLVRETGVKRATLFNSFAPSGTMTNNIRDKIELAFSRAEQQQPNGGSTHVLG